MRRQRHAQPDLAQEFLTFMLSEPFQSVIPTTNWMYPAALPSADLPEGFQTLITPDQSLLFDPAEAAEARDRALRAWLSGLN